MSLWRQLVRGVRALSNRAAVDAELEDEVRDYFERARADLVRQGLTPEEAERVARRELGDLGKARDTLRSYGWENHVDTALGDFRQSWRRLRQNPSFSAVVVATLAVGIGVNVALFSLFQQILLRPLPVAEPERLVNLVDPGLDLGFWRLSGGLTFGSIAGNSDHVFSYPMFRDLERQQGPFAGIAAHRLFDASLSIGESARRDTGFFVSGSYFSVLGLRPALGRLLGPEDDRVDGQAESVVLSHAYWQRELAGDPGRARPQADRQRRAADDRRSRAARVPRHDGRCACERLRADHVPRRRYGDFDPESRQPRLLLGLSVRASRAGHAAADGGERDQSALPGDLERDRSASDHPRRGGASRGVPYEIARARAGRARAERAARSRSGRRSRCCSPSAAPCCSFAAPTSPA